MEQAAAMEAWWCAQALHVGALLLVLHGTNQVHPGTASKQMRKTSSQLKSH
jgi:hypothetical protein